MYAKCVALATPDALHGMHNNNTRDVLTWTSSIAQHVQNGQAHIALELFDQLQHQQLVANAVTFTWVLKACGITRATTKGEEVYHEISKSGLLRSSIVLGTVLVEMYAKCGALVKAQQALEALPVRDVFSWNALIAGYARQGKGEETLHCFRQMKREGICPDAVTFISSLKACGSMEMVDDGERIHNEIIKQGLLVKNIGLGTSLVDMYAKCGDLAKAKQVLEGLPVRNVICWTALLAGYAQQGKGSEALSCLEDMQRDGSSPNAVTFTCILKACGTTRTVEKGTKVHNDIVKQELLRSNVLLGTALIDMYAKCGMLSKARQVLEELPVRDVISWNALIAGHAQEGEDDQVLNCFEGILREGLAPDEVTFTCVLKACGSIGEADKGEEIHEEIAKLGWLGKDIVVGNALVDMYAKCGAFAKARQVLDAMPTRNVVSWNALIAGYCQHGDSVQALNRLEEMRWEGLLPDAVTFMCILKACGSIGAIHKGERIHDQIAHQGLLIKNASLGNALVGMYCKCGALAKAWQVLAELPVCNVTAWNAVIGGYAQQCESEQALDCLSWMQCEGLSPDAATFSSVLSACSRVGRIEDAMTHFVDMGHRYSLKPELEHYSCILDLFGRAGHLDRVLRLIEKIPYSDVELWSPVLDACRKWGDANFGRHAFEFST